MLYYLVLIPYSIPPNKKNSSICNIERKLRKYNLFAADKMYIHQIMMKGEKLLFYAILLFFINFDF